VLAGRVIVKPAPDAAVPLVAVRCEMGMDC
jgi:hypothetical protein